MSDVTNVTPPVTPVCETCGHPIPTVAGIRGTLRGKQRRLFEMIEKAGQHGIEREALFDRLYAGCEYIPVSQNIINVMVAQINPKLAKRGVAIRNAYTGIFRLARLP